MFVLLLSLGVAVLDQIIKDRVMAAFYPGEGIPVVPGYFDLVYVRNTGAAWGMLNGMSGWLAVLSVVMLAAIVIWRRSLISDTLAHRFAFGLITGGIVGNFIDRVRLQYVVDFLDFHWGVHHFPAFNVADSAICVGVGLYILTAFLNASHPLREMGDGSAGDAK